MADSTLTQRKHRQLLYAVSTRLSQDNVKDLMYLAGIEHQLQASTYSGTDLFTILEQKGLLNGQNYSYLISLLETIGRIDLIKVILSDHPSTTLPEKCIGFSVPQQLALIKRGQILGKRELYFQSTYKLQAELECTSAFQQYFDDWFYQLISQLQFFDSSSSHEIHKCFSEQKMCKLLRPLSLFWQVWPETLARFQQTGYCRAVEGLLKLCHQYYDEFYTHIPDDLAPPKESLRYAQGQPSCRSVEKTTKHTLETLQDFFLELFGPQDALAAANASLNEASFTIASMNYCCQYLLFIIKWSLNLIYAVQHGHINIKDIQDVILVIASSHREGIINNYKEIANILGQDSLDELLPHIPAVDETTTTNYQGSISNGSVFSTIMSTLCLFWHTCLAILVQATLPRSPQRELDSILSDLRKLMMNKRGKLANSFILISKQQLISMQEELRKYKDKSKQVILELTNGSPHSADIIRSLLS